MKILGVVAARGGSKGVPNKNIRNIMGKPLISYTVEQMINWGKYDEFIVSTDSDKISEIAREYGAETPFIRPAVLSGDKVGKLDVLRHALSEAERYYNKRFDVLLDLDVTAPIRTVEDIDNMINIFKDKKASCVFSVVKAHKNPYFNMLEHKEDGTVKICKDSLAPILSRQQAPAVYEANASIYVYDREFLLDAGNKTPISKNSLIYEMDEMSGIDIDRELDFKFIEFLVKEGVVKL